MRRVSSVLPSSTRMISEWGKSDAMNSAASRSVPSIRWASLKAGMTSDSRGGVVTVSFEPESKTRLSSSEQPAAQSTAGVYHGPLTAPEVYVRWYSLGEQFWRLGERGPRWSRDGDLPAQHLLVLSKSGAAHPGKREGVPPPRLLQGSVHRGGTSGAPGACRTECHRCSLDQKQGICGSQAGGEGSERHGDPRADGQGTDAP